MARLPILANPVAPGNPESRLEQTGDAFSFEEEEMRY